MLSSYKYESRELSLITSEGVMSEKRCTRTLSSTKKNLYFLFKEELRPPEKKIPQCNGQNGDLGIRTLPVPNYLCDLDQGRSFHLSQ